MTSRTIKDAKDKEIQSIEIVDKYSTANMELVPCCQRVKIYDETIRPQVTGEMIFVTPEMAREFLNRNPNNRLPSPANITMLRNEIESGDWMIGTDDVGFDTNGDLSNGQHRLIALIESGATGAWMFIKKGLDVSYIQKADTGKKRTAADVLKMYQIPAKYVNIIASAAKSAMCILQGKADSNIQSTGYITNTECLAFVQANEKQLLESAKFAKSYKANFLDANTIAFLHFLYSQSNKESIERFFDEVLVGNLNGEKTAAVALKKVLVADKNGVSRLKRKEKLIAYVSYANLYLQNKTSQNVPLNANRVKFPELFEPIKGNMKKTILDWKGTKK